MDTVTLVPTLTIEPKNLEAEILYENSQSDPDPDSRITDPESQVPKRSHGTSSVSASGTTSNVAGSVPTNSPSSSKRIGFPGTLAAHSIFIA